MVHGVTLELSASEATTLEMLVRWAARRGRDGMGQLPGDLSLAHYAPTHLTNLIEIERRLT